MIQIGLIKMVFTHATNWLNSNDSYPNFEKNDTHSSCLLCLKTPNWSLNLKKTRTLFYSWCAGSKYITLYAPLNITLYRKI